MADPRHERDRGDEVGSCQQPAMATKQRLTIWSHPCRRSGAGSGQWSQASHRRPALTGVTVRARPGRPHSTAWVTLTYKLEVVLPDGRPLFRDVSFITVRGMARRWRSSAQTDPGRRRCCASWPATRRRRGRSSRAAVASGVMRQFIGSVRNDSTVRRPARVGGAAAYPYRRGGSRGGRAGDDGTRR